MQPGRMSMVAVRRLESSRGISRSDPDAHDGHRTVGLPVYGQLCAALSMRWLWSSGELHRSMFMRRREEDCARLVKSSNIYLFMIVFSFSSEDTLTISVIKT